MTNPALIEVPGICIACKKEIAPHHGSACRNEVCVRMAAKLIAEANAGIPGSS